MAWYGKPEIESTYSFEMSRGCSLFAVGFSQYSGSPFLPSNSISGRTAIPSHMNLREILIENFLGKVQSEYFQ